MEVWARIFRIWLSFWLAASRLTFNPSQAPAPGIELSRTAGWFITARRFHGAVRMYVREDEMMADRSAIEWTEATWNPTTGCDRVSDGCDHCYAMVLAQRLKAMGSAKYQNDGDPRTSGPGFGLTVHPAALDVPRRWRAGRMIFVNSMSDLFHARVPLGFVQQVFGVIAGTPQHTYQVLTKRAHRLQRLADKLEWPPNLWMGVSVENNEVLDRVDDLRQVPAAVRFLSCEPLLGPLTGLDLTGIGWMIAGGESGTNARPVHPDWVRSLRDQATSARVPFFFKQWGGRTPKAGGRLLDGRTWDQMPLAGYRPDGPAVGGLAVSVGTSSSR